MGERERRSGRVVHRPSIQFRLGRIVRRKTIKAVARVQNCGLQRTVSGGRQFSIVDRDRLGRQLDLRVAGIGHRKCVGNRVSGRCNGCQIGCFGQGHCGFQNRRDGHLNLGGLCGASAGRRRVLDDASGDVICGERVFSRTRQRIVAAQRRVKTVKCRRKFTVGDRDLGRTNVGVEPHVADVGHLVGVDDGFANLKLSSSDGRRRFDQRNCRLLNCRNRDGVIVRRDGRPRPCRRRSCGCNVGHTATVDISLKGRVVGRRTGDLGTRRDGRFGASRGRLVIGDQRCIQRDIAGVRQDVVIGQVNSHSLKAGGRAGVQPFVQRQARRARSIDTGRVRAIRRVCTNRDGRRRAVVDLAGVDVRLHNGVAGQTRDGCVRRNRAAWTSRAICQNIRDNGCGGKCHRASVFDLECVIDHIANRVVVSGRRGFREIHAQNRRCAWNYDRAGVGFVRTTWGRADNCRRIAKLGCVGRKGVNISLLDRVCARTSLFCVRRQIPDRTGQRRDQRIRDFD